MASTNVLSARSLSLLMAASLPPSAEPQLSSPLDAVALATHAGMLAVGFRLVGLGEDHRVEAHSDISKPLPLPAEWNSAPGNYAFRYAHAQSSMEFLLKVNRLGPKAVVMGMAIGDDKTYSFDFKTDDFVSAGNLPAAPVKDDTDSDAAAKKLQNIFISAGRLSDLASMLRVKMIQKLAPSLQKEGYEESTQDSQASTSTQQPRNPARDPLRDDRDPPARPYPFDDPLAAHPRHPRGQMPDPMPGFEDEYDMLRPARRGPGMGGGFPRIGDRDLYPQGMGPNDPLRGGLSPGIGGPMGGGGMHPTFDDPLFAGQGQRGFDPQNPPGSRFDPVGPGMGGHPRGAGMGGRPPGGPPGPFGGPPNPFGGFGSGDFI